MSIRHPKITDEIIQRHVTHKTLGINILPYILLSLKESVNEFCISN